MGGSRVNVGCSKTGCHVDHAGNAKPPTACNTCHGKFLGIANDTISWAPPRSTNGDTIEVSPFVGTHQEHLAKGAISDLIKCDECHLVPSSYLTSGHLNPIRNTKVQFNGALANTVTNEPTTLDYSPSSPLYMPVPVYDDTVLHCNSVYCHGYFKNGNLNNVVQWNIPGSSQIACGTCHGDIAKLTLAERALPKTSAKGGTHPNATDCYLCHWGVVGANLNFVDKTKHINGKLNVYGEERDY